MSANLGPSLPSDILGPACASANLTETSHCCSVVGGALMNSTSNAPYCATNQTMVYQQCSGQSICKYDAHNGGIKLEAKALAILGIASLATLLL